MKKVFSYFIIINTKLYQAVSYFKINYSTAKAILHFHRTNIKKSKAYF